MTNDYYEVTTDFEPFTKGRSGQIDAELAAIEEAFALLPSLTKTRSANTSFVAAGGTANAITVAHPIATWASYTGKDGYKINIQITSTNTDAVTIAVDGLSAKVCKRNDGSALQAGDLVAAGFYDFIYDETAGYFVVPDAINGVLEDCEEQVILATSQTNFIGLWSAQTGAKTVPCSVYHLGSFWALTSNIADIAAKVPGTATEWVLIDNGLSYAGLTGALNTPAVCIHAGYFWNLVANSSDITADVPGVSAKWEKVDKVVYKPVVNYQEFTSSGTWAKPTGNYTTVYVEAVGGGGSGGKGTGPGGGGGGEFSSRILPIADCGSTETVTIGAGGAAQTSATTAGSDGGNSTFGSLLTARGGKAGNHESSASNVNFSNGGDGTKYGGGYGSGAGAMIAADFANAMPAGNSTMGGAGGGTLTATTAGVSQRGGNGGAGSSSGNGGNGSQPGGGGGGTSTGAQSGAGGAGRVRVWTW